MIFFCNHFIRSFASLSLLLLLGWDNRNLSASRCSIQKKPKGKAIKSFVNPYQPSLLLVFWQHLLFVVESGLSALQEDFKFNYEISKNLLSVDIRKNNTPHLLHWTPTNEEWNEQDVRMRNEFPTIFKFKTFTATYNFLGIFVSLFKGKKNHPIDLSK